ncbi:MAG: hypothetical protein R3251_02780 [Candidatus Spechtbacterales bacterium]|nr:hypothetical protein [Candidatus Spechtbacterales bacterium]
MQKLNILRGEIIGLLIFTLFFAGLAPMVYAQDLTLPEADECRVRAEVSANEAANLGVVEVRPYGNPPETLPLDDPQGGDNAIICAFSFIKWISIVIFGVLIAIAVLMIAYSAFLFVSSGDDQSRRRRAKNVLLWAVVGLIIASIARLIPRIAQSIFLA